MAIRPLSELAAHLNQLADSAGAGVSDAELLHRFAESRDQTAFELLVWRHGGLVLGTCRRVLGRSADADDAFQAAFLALARKAGAVRRGESLPGWLHRVALRAALRLRTTAGRRARVESHHLPEDAIACPAPLPDDTAAVLDEEIGQLPDKLRVAFVLCHVLGRTHEEAAEQLGCPRGTVLSRVARARARLQVRLARRGVAPAVAGIVCVEQTVLPAALVASTVGASVGFATYAENVPAPDRVTALAHALARAAPSGWPKPAAAALVVAALIAGAVWAARTPVGAEPPPNQPPAPAPRPAPAEIAQPAPGPARNFKLAPTRHVATVHFSPDSKWLLTTGNDNKDGVSDGGKTLVWDTATGKRVHTPEALFEGKVVFSPDGNLFAIAGSALGKVDTWKPFARPFHRAAYDVSFSPDGKFLVGPDGLHAPPGAATR